MVTRLQSVQNFNDKTFDLINSKFIIAEKKISEVLVCISDSVLLFELFKHVSEGFDYPTVKSVCFSHDAQGVGYFKLPKNDGDVLALALAVLSEIDSGEIDLLKLCAEYFPSVEGKQSSYALFATQLLIPFQQTALRLANLLIKGEEEGAILEQTEESNVEEEEVIEKEQPKATEKTLYFGYCTELKMQSVKVADSLKKGREPYDELYFALEEMEAYLDEKNLRGITLAFTAIKYVAKALKKLEVDCDKIAKVIAENVV